MKSNKNQFAVIGALMMSLILPMTGQAKSLPNKSRALKRELSKCEGEVKRLSSLGYPEKADKQLSKCKKIDSQLSKIEKGQEKVSRKLAAIEKAKKKSKKIKKAKKGRKHRAQSSE